MKENWKYKKLGEVCQTTSGGTPSKEHKEYYENGIIPWLRSGEVANRNITKTELYITNEGVNNSSAKIVPTNSVVIAMYGATVGQVGILRINTTTNQAVCSILPCDEFVPEFVYYFLKSKKEEYVKNAVGGAQPNISQQIIKNTDIPVPPLSVQRQIVAELDLLSDIIEKQKQQIAELDKLAQATFYDMFGDPVTNEKGWEVKKLGEVSEYAKTRTSSDKIKIEEYVSVENMLQNKAGITIASKLPENIGLTRFLPNDILLGNIRPYLKKIWLSNMDGGCNGDVLVIRLLPQCKNEVCPTYLLKILSTEKFFEFDMHFSKGEKMPRGDKNSIMLFPIILPPLSLQQSFASRIEVIEKQKELINNSIKESQRLFDSRMEYWFG